MREAQVKRAMVKATGRVNVLLDSSKFGQRALATFAPLAEVDHLLTDEGIPAEYREACDQLGIELSIV